MGRAVMAIPLLVALGACIPQVDPPYADRRPPPPSEQDRYRRAGDYPPPPPRFEDDDRSYPPEPDAAPPPRQRAAEDERSYRQPDRDAPPQEAPDERPAPVPVRQEASERNAEPDASPPARPAWEARPVTPAAVTVPDSSYVVGAGDTLAAIAARTGTSEGAIALANEIDAPFTVTAGRRLRIPGGRYHLVQQGQSGIAIARAYGVGWSRIVGANALAEPYVLRIGQRVLIPGTTEGSTSLADRAAAFTLDVDDILTGGEPAQAADEPPARPATTTRRVLPPTAVVAAPARLRGGFLWPVDGRVVKRFGPGATGERNDGIKIAVPLSTPIHSVADGVVAYAGSGIAALGGLVIVKHGDGWTSVYGHAGKLLVRRGQAVKQGQTLALSGDTGFADRPEVHFELRKGRTPVDPQAELPRT